MPRGLSFVRYPFESVLRNSRRSLYAAIGIVLALTLLSGSLVAVDSAASGLLNSVLAGTPVDYIVFGENPSPLINESDLQSDADSFETVQYVESSAPIALYRYCDYRNDSHGRISEDYGDFGSIIALPERSEHILSSLRMVGEVPASGAAAISKWVANQLHIRVGDNITCVFSRSTYDSINSTYVTYEFALRIPVSRIWEQDRIDPVNVQGGYWVNLPSEDSIDLVGWADPVVINMADAGLVAALTDDPDMVFVPEITYLIWFERDKVVDVGNMGGTLDRLRFIENRIQQVFAEHNMLSGYGFLQPPIEWLRPEMDRMKVLIAALSLPVITLGIYLTLVGVDLGSSSRRREVAILKSRGASTRQVLYLMTTESLVLGALAGAIGLLAGMGLSRLLTNTALMLSNRPPHQSVTSSLLIDPATIALSVLAGVLLMFASTYRPLRRMARFDVAETLHYYSPKIETVGYNPRFDILLLILAGMGIVIPLAWGEAITGQILYWMISGILSFVVMFAHALLFATPLLLSVPAVRLLTRGSKKMFTKFTVLVKGWTKELHFLVEKNISRNPKRASNLCMIIALALAFGLFISVTVESSLAYERRGVIDDVGADVKVEGYYSYYESPSILNLSAMLDLTSSPGVKDALFFQTFWLDIPTYDGAYGMRASVLDMTLYSDLVGLSDFYFPSSDKALIDELETKGNIAITEETAELRSLLVGDTFETELNYVSVRDSVAEYGVMPLDLEIVGIVKNLPGFPWTEAYLDWATFRGNGFSNFYPASLELAGAFIDLERGANSTDVTERAVVAVSSAGLSPEITVLKDELEKFKNDPHYSSLAQFMYVEFGLSIVIMSLGVGLLTLVAISEREQELACIMARGTSGRQMRQILLGETMTLLIIGVVVGTLVGVFSAAIFNFVTSRTIFTENERDLIFGLATLAVLAASIASLLASSLLASRRVGRIKLAEILRIRTG